MRKSSFKSLLPSKPWVSQTDKKALGYTVARAVAEDAAAIDAAETFALEQGSDVLVLRLSTESYMEVPALQARGYLLTDTLLYFGCRVKTVAEKGGAPKLPVRLARKEDGPLLAKMAEACFHEFPSHYHADPRMNPTQCGRVYALWIQTATNAQLPNEPVIVVEENGRVTGFGVLKVHSDSVGEAVLAGVSPDAPSRMAVYRALLQGGTEIVLNKGVREAFTSTQIQNVIIQRAWIDAGWLPMTSYYTFHKWFSDKVLSP